MRAGARKVVSDSDNRVMSLIIGYRRSRTESEKRDNSVKRHLFPPGGAAQKREVGENDIWAKWPLLAHTRPQPMQRFVRCWREVNCRLLDRDAQRRHLLGRAAT